MSAYELHPPPPPGPHLPEPLDARVWMPQFLFVLQMSAHSYADAPSDTLRKKYYQILTDLPLTLPDARWQAWFSQALTELPVQAFLVDRQAVAEWVYRIRCRVHEQFEWPTVSFAQHHETFYRTFRPAPITAEIGATQRRMYGALAAGVVLVLGLAFYSAKDAVARGGGSSSSSSFVPFPVSNALDNVSELARDGTSALLEITTALIATKQD